MNYTSFQPQLNRKKKRKSPGVVYRISTLLNYQRNNEISRLFVNYFFRLIDKIGRNSRVYVTKTKLAKLIVKKIINY